MHGGTESRGHDGTHRTRRSDGAPGTPAPVLVVPGFGHVEQAWLLLRRHLERAGFEHVAVAPAQPAADIPHMAEQIARHAASLLELSGHHRLHLVAHNVAGVAARYYVQLLDGDQVVETVVSVATPHAGTTAHAGFGPAAAQLRRGSRVLRHIDDSTRPLPVHWVSYFAERDLFVDPTTSGMLREPLLRATNLLVRDHAHLSLMIPPSLCRSIAHQLAAAEGVEGYGSSVAAFPAHGRSADAVERSKAAHPSQASTWHPPMLVVSLTGQEDRVR